jgi:UDP:flavonoid glycosyltransferase YjiC (YdhE family)
MQRSAFGSTVVLATVGSLGDLHPFVALGLALQARGARVIVACAAEYQSKVERAGLLFRAVRPSFDDMQRTVGMDRADITRALLSRQDFLLRRLIMPHLRDSYDDMVEILGNADMLVSSSLAFGARLAAERRALPWIGVVLQPSMFMSAFDPPQVPGADALSELMRRLGPGVARPLLALGKRLLARQLRPVHALRAAIGLAPTAQNPLFEGQFGAAGAVGLYSPVLGGVLPDYPKTTAVVGFAPFDSVDGTPATLEAPLKEFLGVGAPPLVFTLGSLIVHSPGAFYRDSVAAARKSGRRAVLLVGEEGRALHAELAATDVHVAAYAPHSLLFPRAAAIVHHGGIGTLAQALRSGRPHLVVPFYADQLDNAMRARRLGLARVLRPRRYSRKSAARELAVLLNEPAYDLRAGDVKRLIGLEDGAGDAARFIALRMAGEGAGNAVAVAEGSSARIDR